MDKGEEGAGTVLAVGLVFVMLLLTAMVLGLGQAAVAAAKAATAADLSALAAADAYRGLSVGSPCQIAADVAALHGASLLDCTLAGDQSVRVSVSIRTALPWLSTGMARAGPPPDTVGPGHP
ncbi:Rv3654c family TadE-like protein [Arthrobacter sp. TWP1-1]|uniref:Rv3654c family TadE-like protein n=1 Tax=Arthrobacter sp. TWP1-1 TaxID=2804568 RepID=UPI003CFB89AD